MSTQSGGARRTLLANSWIQLGLVAVIVLLANTFAARHFVRVDLTRERLHSLDDASKRLVASLERPLVIKAYVSRGLEAPYNNHEAALRDKLEEYQAYARGRLQFSLVDPADDPEALAEAQKYGLAPLDYTVRNQDRSELRKIWLGAALLYGDRQETLPAISDLASLEYDLSSAIHRLSSDIKDRKVLGWATGHGEPDLTKPEGPLRTLVEQLGRKFTLTSLTLGGEGTIPEEVDALLVVGPQKALSTRALYQIDQLLMRGGAAGIFVMNVRPDLRALRPVGVSSGLDPLLGHYGLIIGKNLVIDRAQNGAMRFPVKVGQLSGLKEINYPLIPKVTDLSDESVLTSGLDAMLFPFVSTITPAAELPAGVKVEVLARTSSASGAIQRIRSVDPTAFEEVMDGEQRGPFPVLVAATGPFRSFFETRPVPSPDPGVIPVGDPDRPEEAPLQVEGNPTRLVVAGSADFVANNVSFMLSLCDWLVQDEALIGIRSKLMTTAPLASTTPAEQSAWKAFNLLAGPLLLLIYGAVRQLRRRAA